MRCIAGRIAAAVIVTAANLSFGHNSASAQQSLQPVRVVGDEDARANALHEAALRLAGDMDRYHKAAGMHLRSAAMRAATDGQGVDCMVRAGVLRYYSGDLDGAQEALTAAAERAGALGDVVSEANAYVDAAFIAQERRRPSEAVALGKRAEVLASSPLLAAAQRTAITARLQFAGATNTKAGEVAVRPAPAAAGAAAAAPR